MPRKKKVRGRPPVHPLPPRIEATTEQLAQAMFAMPADHQWKYLDQDPEFRCGQCEKVVTYPEVLTDGGLCAACSKASSQG